MTAALQFTPCISVKAVREVEPGYLLGTMYVEGIEHHLELIEVVENTQTGEQEARRRGTYEEWAINQQRYPNFRSRGRKCAIFGRRPRVSRCPA